MASISLRNVTKAFENGSLAVDHLSLEVTDGEFMVLVGPSGCGKSTSLRMVAGLEDPTDGEIAIGGQVVNDVPSRRRDIAMVFQNYALYPHMSVLDNLGFGLRMQGITRADRERRARDAAEVLGIGDLLGRRPKQLSGGQRQRVAMGRAIVRHPQAFLMDEPLSNLDAKLRVQMRAEIAALQRRLGTTTLYVTHDQVEAMTMADRVAVMHRGVLQQIATPTDLYERPANLFVAGFIGSPPMNLFDGCIRCGSDGPLAGVGDQWWQLPPGPWEAMDGRSVVVGMRPEDLTVVEGSTAPGSTTVEVDVVTAEQLGSDLMVYGRVAGDPSPIGPGGSGTPGAELRPLEASSLIARCPPRLRATRGDRLRMSVPTERLHVFDRQSGENLAG